MWCARFTESQLETLKDLIRIQGEVGSDLEGALEALELARWDDLPEARAALAAGQRAGRAAGHQRGGRDLGHGRPQEGARASRVAQAAAQAGRRAAPKRSPQASRLAR